MFVSNTIGLNKLCLISSSKVKELADTKFNGIFYNYYEIDNSEKDYFFSAYEFDGTNYLSTYFEHIVDSAVEPVNIKLLLGLELKINSAKTMFRTRIWKGEKKEWKPWQKYEFIDDNTLRIWSDKESYTDYIKKSSSNSVM